MKTVKVTSTRAHSGIKKSLLAFAGLVLIIPGVFPQGSYAPAAGKTGSTAIASDSPVFTGWATGGEVVRGYVNIADKSYQYLGTNRASFGVPSNALFAADKSGAVSLGDSGRATLTFGRPIINGNGPDFAVFENGIPAPTNAFLELGFVEVSSDGTHFVRFPAVDEYSSSTQIGTFETMDASYLNNFAGKYVAGYGVPFDLDDVKDSAHLDVNNIRFVRIVDAIGNVDPQYPFTQDSKGNVVNDPFPTPFHTSGFDLDAVGIINGGNAYNLSDCSNLSLASGTYYNPGASGSFTSGNVTYPYRLSTYSWDGFAYSNTTDDTTGEYANQYSAITAGGVDSTGSNYIVSYVTSDWSTYKLIPDTITFADGLSHALSGFYATNSTYAYYTMKNGSMFSKVFGGADGTDADWFKLSVWGQKEDGTLTDSVEFYLADFRFTRDTLDYIVNDWRWVDLQSLGKVKKLMFSLGSSDASAWGINTPAYFCMDNLTVIPSVHTSTEDHNKTEGNAPVLFPNPTHGSFSIAWDDADGFGVSVYTLTGSLVYRNDFCNSGEAIDISNLAPGTYLVKSVYKNAVKYTKLIKQ
jgi:hypothetical protein